MSCQSPSKCSSTLNTAVFCSSSSLHSFVGGSDGLVCESVGKDALLLGNFDSKQSRESVDLPLTCHPTPSFYDLCLPVE